MERKAYAMNAEFVSEIQNEAHREAMLKQLMSYAFAENELALFLDTHPQDLKALEMHKSVAEKLKKLPCREPVFCLCRKLTNHSSGHTKCAFPASRPSIRIFCPVQKRFVTVIKYAQSAASSTVIHRFSGVSSMI